MVKSIIFVIIECLRETRNNEFEVEIEKLEITTFFLNQMFVVWQCHFDRNCIYMYENIKGI